MNYNNLTLIILCIAVFYILFIKKEGMSNTAIDNRIKAIYQADINSIRNLSKLANDLTANGKLVVPGGLEIKGNLKVGGNVGVKRDPHPKVGLIVNGTGLINAVETVNGRYGFYSNKTLGVAGSIRLQTNGDISGRHIHGYSINAAKGGLNAYSNLYVRGTSRLDGNVGVRRAPHPKIGLIVNGRGLTWGLETVSAGIYCDKNLQVTGNVGVRRAPHPKVGLIVDGSGRSVGIETNTTMKSANREVVRHGDGVYIKRGSTWLNSTNRGDSSRGSGFSGWTYWRSGHDGDSNLNIYKR